MSDEKIKIYKNKERGKTEVRKNYVPQYQIMGLEPEEIKSAVAGSRVSSPAAPTNDNPRTRRVGIRQPYAEVIPSPVGRHKSPVPNVGNNMEHTWSSVNDEIVDDLSNQDYQSDMKSRPIIDNNDYVSDATLGLSQDDFPEYGTEDLPTLDEVASPPRKQFVSETDDAEDVSYIIHQLEDNDYLMLVGGVAVCSGPLEEVQEQARLLVFGDHKLCDGNPIPADDIVVIKRVPIKIGLFLE